MRPLSSRWVFNLIVNFIVIMENITSLKNARKSKTKYCSRKKVFIWLIVRYCVYASVTGHTFLFMHSQLFF